MSRARIGYLVALIVAVVVLLGSVVGAVAWSASPVRADRQVGDDRGPGGWMGDDRGPGGWTGDGRGPGPGAGDDRGPGGWMRGDRPPDGRGSMMGPGAGRMWQQPGTRPTPRATPSTTS